MAQVGSVSSGGGAAGPAVDTEPGKTLARAILVLIRAQQVEGTVPGSIMVEPGSIMVDFAEKTLAQAFNEALNAHK